MPIEKTFPPAANGCFLGQPVGFFCNYVDAVADTNRMRSMQPGLYNVNRLNEVPLPNLDQNTDGSESEDENPNNNSQQNVSDAEEEQPNAHNDSSTSFDELAVSSSSDGVIDPDPNNANKPEHQRDDVTSSTNPVPSCSNVRDENETKPVLHLLQRADVTGIDAILNDKNHDDEEEEEDEIEFVVVNGNFPRPVQYSCDGLIKRDDDPISGNLAYADAPQVCIHISRFFLSMSCANCVKIFTEKWKSYLQSRFKNGRDKEKHS